MTNDRQNGAMLDVEVAGSVALIGVFVCCLAFKTVVPLFILGGLLVSAGFCLLIRTAPAKL